MNRDKMKMLTQLDYIKILIEDDRLGEASDIIYDVSSNIELKLKNIAEKVNNSNVELPKVLVKTKANEWLNINDVWYKMKSINKDQIIVALNRNNTVQMSYKINKNLKIA